MAWKDGKVVGLKIHSSDCVWYMSVVTFVLLKLNFLSITSQLTRRNEYSISPIIPLCVCVCIVCVCVKRFHILAVRLYVFFGEETVAFNCPFIHVSLVFPVLSSSFALHINCLSKSDWHSPSPIPRFSLWRLSPLLFRSFLVWCDHVCPPLLLLPEIFRLIQDVLPVPVY